MPLFLEENRRDSIHIPPVISQVFLFIRINRARVTKFQVPKICLQSLLNCRFLGQGGDPILADTTQTLLPLMNPAERLRLKGPTFLHFPPSFISFQWPPRELLSIYHPLWPLSTMHSQLPGRTAGALAQVCANLSLSI